MNRDLDIVKAIISSYMRFPTPDISLIEKFHFVKTTLETQILEMEEALTKEDFNHAAEELADVVLVGVDWLHRMGFNPYDIIINRALKNSKKDLGNRDIKYYRDKSEKLRREMFGEAFSLDSD
jgi:hypothetical protein